MDNIDKLLDLFNKTLLEAEANNAEYVDHLERCRIEDRKHFAETRDRLDAIQKDIEVIKGNLGSL